MISLAPCPSCMRHVRVTERACPFCGSAREPESRSRARVAPWPRATRFATVVFGAALSSAAVGCVIEPGTDHGGVAGGGGGDSAEGGGGAGGSGGGGGTAGDASDGGQSGAVDDDGTAIPHYGAPGCAAAEPGDDSPLAMVAALALIAALRRRR